MGTNYYLRRKTPIEIRPQFHIAKLSWGWKPSFEANDGGSDIDKVYYERPSVNSIDDIYKLVESDKWGIYDEYGDPMSLEEFLDLVDDWGKGKEFKSHIGLSSYMKYYKDANGFEFTRQEFC